MMKSTFNGQNGQPMNGQPMNGQPMQQQNFGRPMNGQPMNGQPMQQQNFGQPMNGRPMNGQPMNNFGQPMNGQPMNGYRQPQPSANVGDQVQDVMNKIKPTLMKVKETLMKFFADPKKRMIAIGGAAGFVFLIVAITVITKLTGPDHIALSYVKSFANSDYNALVNSFAPPVQKAFDEMIDEYYDGSASEAKSEFKEQNSEDMEDYFGDHIKFKYDVKSSKSCKRSEISRMNDELEELCDELVIKSKEITAAKTVKINVRIEGSDEKETAKCTITVVKIGGKWGVWKSTDDCRYFMDEFSF